MAVKQKLKDGFEQDWVSRYWRSVTNWNPGVGKYIKRRLNKRFRKDGKRQAGMYNDTEF